MAAALFSITIGAFATWVVAHAVLCSGLVRNPAVSELTQPWSWVRYLLWLPPFALVAPYLGFRVGEIKAAATWVVAAACYLAALVLQYQLLVE